MARRPRLQFRGAVYHVMSRGNRKLPIFDDDEDRRRFLVTLEEAVRRYEIRCYAACLMNNHYHLVFDTPRGNLSDAMRHVNGVYTQASNRRHKRTGHVFEARFRSIVVERESYLRRVVRYVVLNPVRAGLVQEASAWAWSSYRATAGLEPQPPWLYQLDWIDGAFPSSSRTEAQFNYRLYVNNPVPKKPRLDLQTLAVGTPEFQAAVIEAAKSAQADRPLPRVYRAPFRPTLQRLLATGPDLVERNRAIYTAHVTHAYSLANIAAFLGLDRSTVSRALRKSMFQPEV